MARTALFYHDTSIDYKAFIAKANECTKRREARDRDLHLIKQGLLPDDTKQQYCAPWFKGNDEKEIRLPYHLIQPPMPPGNRSSAPAPDAISVRSSSRASAALPTQPALANSQVATPAQAFRPKRSSSSPVLSTAGVEAVTHARSGPTDLVKFFSTYVETSNQKHQSRTMNRKRRG
mmetsp:Transcript_158850/g.289604  ORF Transcript_158850/g.289604 Transcript_158850/m.289604 type:complete len:176 (-) Transcript_158850:8-535(-)